MVNRVNNSYYCWSSFSVIFHSNMQHGNYSLKHMGHLMCFYLFKQEDTLAPPPQELIDHVSIKGLYQNSG